MTQRGVDGNHKLESKHELLSLAIALFIIEAGPFRHFANMSNQKLAVPSNSYGGLSGGDILVLRLFLISHITNFTKLLRLFSVLDVLRNSAWIYIPGQR